MFILGNPKIIYKTIKINNPNTSNTWNFAAFFTPTIFNTMKKIQTKIEEINTGNPVAIKMLKDTNRWCDPYVDNIKRYDCLSCFDSFEHIEEPNLLLEKITTQHIVVTIPIFDDYKSLLKSKHFKPSEHYHYFTKIGLINYMEKCGFICIHQNDDESKAGREDIYTFIFKRG